MQYVNHGKKRLHKHFRVFRRYRESSGILIRTLEHLRNKNGKIIGLVYKGIRSYILYSFKVHCYVRVKKKNRKWSEVFVQMKGPGTIHQSIIKLTKKASRYLSWFPRNGLCSCKRKAHAANYIKFELTSELRSFHNARRLEHNNSSTI